MSSGTDILVSYAKGSAWGTAVDANVAGGLILCDSVSDFEAIPEELPDESAGSNFLEYIDAGNVIVQPTIEGWLRYDSGVWRIIAALIGDDVITTTAGTNYDHTMDVQTTLPLFGTLAYYDGSDVREIPSFLPTSVTLSAESGSFWKYSFTGIGDDVLTDGQTNTTLGSATAASKVLRTPFGSTKFRINTDAGALDAADVLYPKSYSLTISRPIVPNFLSNAVAEGSGEFNTRLPSIDGHKANLELTVSFPEFTDESWLEAVHYLTSAAEVTAKADITILGGTDLGGTEFSTITCSLPLLRNVSAKSPASGPQRIPETLVLRGLQAQAAPTGMTGITDLIRIVTRNENSTAFDV